MPPVFSEKHFYMLKKFTLLLLAACPFIAMAQLNTATGFIQEVNTTEPAAKAIVTFSSESKTFTTTTDESGKFAADVEQGTYKISVKIGDKEYEVLPMSIDGEMVNGNMPVIDKRLVNLGTMVYKTAEGVEDDSRQNQENIPTVSLSETDNRDGGAQNVSSALNASRDVFLSTASFIFGNVRFRMRGYDFENYTTYMNGVPVNDLEDGGTFWGQWGGLNNVMWNRENTLGLQPTTFTFGGIGGAYALDSRASKQRKQLQVSYATTNRNYRHRLMATYSTGLLKHGWAVSVSFSRRWAAEGYVPGTFYDGYSYFLSVEKFFGTKHSLALTAFGTPTRNGRNTAAVQEMYDLAGTNYYNPNWGWQNGKKRNATVGNNHQPMIILTHEFKINNQSNLTTAAGFSFGIRSSTALDWNNASDPRPDYYRYLPSALDDTLQRAYTEKLMRDNESLRQINWERLYEANYTSMETIDSVNGIAGNSVTGKRARYIIENRIQNNKRFDFASTYNSSINDHISVTAALTYQMLITENYKKVDDLLGADFYVDVNQFAVRDFPDSFSVAQNDLNNPNRILKVGDKWGYNYESHIHRPGVFGQAMFKYNHIDFFLSTELSLTAFWRNGKTLVGLFPETSFGKSEVQKFFNYAFKGGLNYKINGRNYLYANGSYLTRAPSFDNSFVSPRTRNTVAANLVNEKVYSAEAGYRLTTPRVKLRAGFFFAQFNDQTKNIIYFHDDFRTLVNYTMTNIDTRHWGFEFGAEAKVYKGFSVTGVASIGRYTYVSRPTATITQDNSEQVVSNELVYAKGFNVGGTPQLATSFGINYRDPKFWFVNVNLNYYDWMWLDFSPARRTEGAVETVDPSSSLFSQIVNQQKLKGQFTMDIFAGYSWLLNNQFRDLKKRHFLIFNIGVSNVTNNKSFITGGFEQVRFDFNEKNVDKFPPKYFYGYGTTYFVSLAYRMQ